MSTSEDLNELARRHGFGLDAVQAMQEAVERGQGGMAQFSHPELGGSGQWMRGGMTQVGDMFNQGLKARVAALAADLAARRERVPTSGDRAADAGGAAVFGSRPATGSWWPGTLGVPNTAGAQDGVRYAWFGDARRLAIERGGRVTVYDTLDHRIGGVSQQQGGSSSLSFTSQHGPVDIERLPVVDV